MARRVIVLAILLSIAGSAGADSATSSTSTYGTTSSSSSGMGWHGWGVRFGMATDVDQVQGGAHANLGDVARNLRFQPDVMIGSGDDATTVYGTAPLYYRFHVNSRMLPYAGGGVALGYVQVDAPAWAMGGDESEFEVGAKATGGLEWEQSGSQALAVEMSVGFGDVHDLQVLAAWSF
jgi:opacity protein-like surface antigen